MKNPFRFFPVARMLVASITLSAVSASAATVIVLAQRETAIFAENADYNLGVGNLIAGTNAFGGDNARSLLEFNVASLVPAGSTITSVVFEIGTIRQSNRANPSAYELHRFLKDWTEGNGGLSVNTGSPAAPGETTWNSQFHGTALWNAPGTQAGKEYFSIASGVGPEINSGDVVYSIASTPGLVADVQAWLDNPAGNDGWIFIGSSEGVSGTARRFSSTEVPGDGISSTLTPRITIAYTAPAPVPEPGTALWAACFAFFAAQHRHRIRSVVLA